MDATKHSILSSKILLNKHSDRHFSVFGASVCTAKKFDRATYWAPSSQIYFGCKILGGEKAHEQAPRILAEIFEVYAFRDYYVTFTVFPWRIDDGTSGH